MSSRLPPGRPHPAPPKATTERFRKAVQANGGAAIVAANLGISRQAVYAILNGGSPELATAASIEALFQIPIGTWVPPVKTETTTIKRIA